MPESQPNSKWQLFGRRTGEGLGQSSWTTEVVPVHFGTMSIPVLG